MSIWFASAYFQTLSYLSISFIGRFLTRLWRLTRSWSSSTRAATLINCSSMGELWKTMNWLEPSKKTIKISGLILAWSNWPQWRLHGWREQELSRFHFIRGIEFIILRKLNKNTFSRLVLNNQEEEDDPVIMYLNIKADLHQSFWTLKKAKFFLIEPHF